jgi:hypothetical protein
MSNKQQTAVEWIFSQLPDEYTTTRSGFDVYQQAKEMEKEQIKNAHIEGQSCVHCPIIELAEEFYNETYGGN